MEEEEPSTVRLRGGDGVEFLVEASRLAALAPGFAFPVPAIYSSDVYRIVQEYRFTREAFTDPFTGEVTMPQMELAENDIIADVHDVDTIGYLAYAAMELNMNDLLALCHRKMTEVLVEIGLPQIILILDIGPAMTWILQ